MSLTPVKNLCRLLPACLLLAAPWATFAKAAVLGRTDFPSSIAALSPSSHVLVVRNALTSDESAAPLTVVVGVRMRNFAELRRRIDAGEVISRAELDARFFPLAGDAEPVAAWLRSQGADSVRVDPTRLSVTGTVAVAKAADAFRVTFARVAVNGVEYTSAITSPSLPDSIAAQTMGVHGLQTHVRPHPLVTPTARRSPGVPTLPTPSTLVSGGSPSRKVVRSASAVSGYVPSQIATAYAMDPLSATGAGQTIAILAAAFPAPDDLVQFWKEAAVSSSASTSNFQFITVGNGPTPATAGDTGNLESSTDSEWASGIAPGASIRVYAANLGDGNFFDEILLQIIGDLPSQPNLHELSVSYSFGETQLDPDYMGVLSQYFATLAASGVGVFVASGDSGSDYEFVRQVQYPASDPSVTGVGGTTLTLDPLNVVLTETAWPNSGGGFSSVFPLPSWQSSIQYAYVGKRMVPDIAAVADDTFPGNFVVSGGANTTTGGTSFGAPTMAGALALINEWRSRQGLGAVGYINPKLYALMGTGSFRDILTGGNTVFGAVGGYDLITGVGVPVVSALAKALTSSPLAPAVVFQSRDRFTTQGQPTGFSATANGSGPISFQWKRKAAGTTDWISLADGPAYSGAATSMLCVDGASDAMSGDQFQCVATNSAGSATTAPAINLTVADFGVSTLAGWPGTIGAVDGQGWAARFGYPGSVRVDSAGIVYVADGNNNTVRKISPDGTVTTLAGQAGVAGWADGNGTSALFNEPSGVAIDPAGNVFVSDNLNFVIRKIAPDGTVTTLAGTVGVQGTADGTGSAAQFYDMQDIAIDPSGNLFVTDGWAYTVRKVTPSGVVTTFAGTPMSFGSTDGQGSDARFGRPIGVATDLNGSVYVTEGYSTIRKITPEGLVSHIAGYPLVNGSADGPGPDARFHEPSGIAVDAAGMIYVADTGNHTIRRITPDGVVTTIAGSPGLPDDVDGPAPATAFNTPGDVAVGPSGVIYVADSGNYTIRKIVPNQAAVQTTRLVNLSTRAFVGAGANELLLGFYVRGSGSEPLLVRGVGPALARFSVSGTMVLPQLSLESSDGSVIAANSGWGGSSTLAAAFARDGAFGFAPGSADTALLTSLEPGSYSAVVGPPDATSAIAMCELYEDGGGPFATRLVNLSSRAFVGTGANVLIGGFVVEGSGMETVLIRGIGPTLTNFGVTGVLPDPTITVYNASGTAIATNTKWEPSLTRAFSDVGAFALPQGSGDSALVLILAPGAYSVVLQGASGDSGIALVEIYEIAP